MNPRVDRIPSAGVKAPSRRRPLPAPRGRQRPVAALPRERLEMHFELGPCSEPERDEFRARISAYQRRLFSRGSSANDVVVAAIEERAGALLLQAKMRCDAQFAKDVRDARLSDAERERFGAMAVAFVDRLDGVNDSISMDIDDKRLALTLTQKRAVEYVIAEYRASIAFATREAALRVVSPILLTEILTCRRGRSNRGPWCS